MKKIFAFSVFLLVLLLLLPLFALENNPTEIPTAATVSTSSQEAVSPVGFKVLITETNTVTELSAEDYLYGVLAGEMPALYEVEALKAQAVCAYTFAVWRQKENKDKNYDISDDYTVDQCYITPLEADKKWGAKADEYEKKLRGAIREVLGEILTYNGEPILSVYHAVSGGFTESAKNVWGKDYPYLQAAASVGDKLATNYISESTFTADQLENAFSVAIPAGLKGTFTDFMRTKSGTVKTVKICGKEFKGSEVRAALELKSSNFEVAIKNGAFTFTVYGYGHGVGLSQNGANYMAQQGSDYKEILAHYYKGCKIENL